MIWLLTSLGAMVESPSPWNGNPFLCILVQFPGKLEHVHFSSPAKAQEVCSDTCSSFWWSLNLLYSPDIFHGRENHLDTRLPDLAVGLKRPHLQLWKAGRRFPHGSWRDAFILSGKLLTNSCGSHLVLQNGDAWDNPLEDQCCSFSSPTAYTRDYPRKSPSVILGL